MADPSLALETRDLWSWYEPAAPVLRGIDLSVARGQLVALVGANGSGKTTLIKHFNGLLRPHRGRVRVEGQDAAGRSLGELARQVGYLFQRPEQQIFSATVRQELAFGPRNLGLPPAAVQERVEAALARFNLAGVAEQPPAILGYGLRRRVTLASLAAMDPPILVLDEPTVGLDAAGLRETFGWLAELHAAGRTIVLVTHDMELAAAHAGRVVVLSHGQVIADGPPAELFRQGDLLLRAALVAPPVLALAQALQPLGLRGDSLTVESFAEEFGEKVREKEAPPPTPCACGRAARRPLGWWPAPDRPLRFPSDTGPQDRCGDLRQSPLQPSEAAGERAEEAPPQSPPQPQKAAGGRAAEEEAPQSSARPQGAEAGSAEGER